MLTEPNQIKQIIISGLGVMGASLAMAIRQSSPGIQIIGHDLDEVVQEAITRGIVDMPLDQWPQSCKDAEIIFLATPLKILRTQLKDINGIVDKQTIVTDVASTKMELAQLIDEIQFTGTYVGGHPMTGAEKSGLKAANPLLYENAVYILTGISDNQNGIIKEKLISLLQNIKARIMFLDAQSHDKVLAAISHLPQLTAIALINLIGDKNDPVNPYFELAAGGFRDLTRIASSSISIWQDIISSNAENVHQILTEFISILQSELDSLDNLGSQFKEANAHRDKLPKQNKGFLSPLTDILVYVTDEVGVVAKIANTLTDKGIDIRDIELLKIREKEGGVFRLSFASEKESRDAIVNLNAVGYRAYLRE